MLRQTRRAGDFHCLHRAAVVRSLARVLRPGGLLVFVDSFPDPDRLGVPVLRYQAEPEGLVFQDCTGTAWRDVVRLRRVSL